MQTLERSGHDVSVETVEPRSAFKAEIKTAFELYGLLAEQVQTASRSERFPLVLSGNCSSALGTIAGAGAERLGIVWFDAHGDFNTPDTSVSGFLDGMGLAAAAGLCWRTLAASIPGFRPVVGADVIHAGCRDFSVDERRLFDQAGVTVITSELIRHGGASQALTPALEILSARVERIYLHVALDVLDPEIAMTNEFAPPDGLTVEHVEEAIALIGR